jgi:hypothetical protein
MLFASKAVSAVVAALAIVGVLMTRIAPAISGALLARTLAYGLALDFVKVAVLAACGSTEAQAVRGATVAEQFSNGRLSSRDWRFVMAESGPLTGQVAGQDPERNRTRGNRCGCSFETVFPERLSRAHRFF